MGRVAAIPILVALAALLASCGGGEGASAGATVGVYVAAGLCAEARGELARAGDEAGEPRARIRCLAPERDGSRLDLATVGANARRATEDSTAVAYLIPPDPGILRFSAPILRSADLGWLQADSGAAAMRKVLTAIARADPASIRDEVRESLRAR